MLCPYCLANIEEFERHDDDDATTSYTCPECQELVPLLYIEDYAKYPPVIFSLVGFTGVGKTVFFASLLSELDRARNSGPEWSNFSWMPIDEDTMREVRPLQAEFEQGRLPNPTHKVFPKPAALTLRNVSEFGKCRALVYDTGGETFTSGSADLLNYGRYVTQTDVIIWLVSFAEMNQTALYAAQTAARLTDFLTTYINAMRSASCSPKNQTLLVVLTKGDEMVDMQGLPEDIGDFLRAKKQYSLKDWKGLSHSLEGFLECQPGVGNFIANAREEFGRVQFGIVSALGAKPTGKTLQVGAQPRGILMPLLYVVEQAFNRRNGRARRSESPAEDEPGDIDHDGSAQRHGPRNPHHDFYQPPEEGDNPYFGSSNYFGADRSLRDTVRFGPTVAQTRRNYAIAFFVFLAICIGGWITFKLHAQTGM